MDIMQIGREKAVTLLQSGDVIVSPTDTIYGLLADACNAAAIKKVFDIKGRDPQKPLGVFVKDMDMAKEFAEISEQQEEYLQSVWPGKVTAVLKSKGNLPEELGSKDTIGIRVPDNELLQFLMDQLGRPLVQTSVNISGEPHLSDPKEIVALFENEEHAPTGIINAGMLPESEPSQVVDITQGELTIVRA